MNIAKCLLKPLLKHEWMESLPVESITFTLSLAFFLSLPSIHPKMYITFHTILWLVVVVVAFNNVAFIHLAAS